MADANTTAPVFLFDDAAALAEVVPGSVLRLEGAEGKHALVQRLQVGEPADLVDGHGSRARCVVTGVERNGLSFEVLDIVREPQPGVSLTLVQALAKGGRDELAIETAVEVGVDAIVPWQADRSIVQWRADKAAKSKAKWVDAVRAATKQARRAFLPPVDDVVNSKQLAKRIEQVVHDGGAAWVLDAGGNVTAATAELPIESSCAQSQDPAPTIDSAAPAKASAQNDSFSALLVIVGPEGGNSPAELDAFTKAGAQLVKLGPHIMRTSTAGPIAVSRAAERLGRWG